MSDRILIRDLQVFARHGVLPEEERLGQRLQSAHLLRHHQRAADAAPQRRLIDNHVEVPGQT